MALIKGGFLRLLQTALYFLAFLCSAITLGIYSYFLAVLADRNAYIPTYEKAVEGLSGAAVLYTIFATVLTCCLGGISFFAFLAIVLDVAFVGAMIANAVLTDNGASSCKHDFTTPLGSVQGEGFHSTNGDHEITYSVSPRTACRLNTAAFAVSIIAAFIFVITALMQIALVRHHKKEKRFGPSPSNNYTSGYGKRKFWQRKPKNDGAARDAEIGATGGVAAAGPDGQVNHEAGAPIKEQEGTHTGYYTQPQGTGVNPYGYSTGTATNY